MKLPLCTLAELDVAAAEVRALNLSDSSRKVKALHYFVEGITSGQSLEQLRIHAQRAAVQYEPRPANVVPMKKRAKAPEPEPPPLVDEAAPRDEGVPWYQEPEA